MDALIAALRRTRPFAMGGHAGIPNAIDIEALRGDLRQVARRSDRFLWVWVMALAVLFVLDCAALYVLIDTPRVLAAVFTATGVGFVSVLAQMRQAWREKFITETLLAMAPAMTPSELARMLDQLLASWLKQAHGRHPI